MHEIINFIVSTVGDWGYLGIFIMMTIESSFIPFPSELAMIPAGYLASQGEMYFSFALLVGTFGAIVGATINYLIAFKLGEPITKGLIKRFGKYMFLKLEHYDASEKYFLNHGSITVFLARFIPAVRQLISLPAGAFEMNYTKFFIYTGIGAGIWNLILMSIGYMAGENKELIAKYSWEFLIGSLVFVVVVGIGYYLKNKKK